LLRRIEPGSEPAGTHQIVWDGKDQLGQSCSSGIYRIRMDTANGSYIRRMVLAK
jgi:flagellar hook assembly protein FlgD